MALSKGCSSFWCTSQLWRGGFYASKIHPLKITTDYLIFPEIVGFGGEEGYDHSCVALAGGRGSESGCRCTVVTSLLSH